MTFYVVHELAMRLAGSPTIFANVHFVAIYCAALWLDLFGLVDVGGPVERFEALFGLRVAIAGGERKFWGKLRVVGARAF